MTYQKQKKTLISLLFLIATCFFLLKYHNELTTFVNTQIKKFMQKEIVIQETNEYTKTDSYEFIQLTNDFTPKNYQEMLNIYYTVINNGWDNFYFHCEEEYDNCLIDLKKISQDQTLLTTINNYTHPFNNYNTIKTSYDNYENIYVEIEKSYAISQISAINSEVDKIYNNIIKESMTLEQKIETIHDYIIDNSIYDEERGETFNSAYNSDLAYGPILEGYGICLGYTDAMAIFLEKLDIKNYKVANDVHVWNFLELDNNWFHLDLTWDDPITNTGKQIIDHTYFLLTTDELAKLNEEEEEKIHTYDSNVYLEN